MSMPQAYHAVKHIISEPVCTVDEFKAQVMEVRLTEANWPTYEPLLRGGNGTYYAHWNSRSSVTPRTIHVVATGEGLLVLQSRYLDTHRQFNFVRTWNHIDGRRWFINEGYVWIERTEFLDANRAIEAYEAAAA